MVERPALALEIAGRVDPKAEADAIRRERLAARLRALKRRQADGADPEAGAPQAGASQDGEARARQERQEEAATAAGVTVTPEEYPALLQRLYEETDFPDKPRDSRSSAKPLEVAELEKALMGAIVVDADSARRLGTRRAQVVQRRLAAQGKVPEGRMFVLAPRIDPKAAGPNRSKPQCTASCAEFSLR